MHGCFPNTHAGEQQELYNTKKRKMVRIRGDNGKNDRKKKSTDRKKEVPTGRDPNQNTIIINIIC